MKNSMKNTIPPSLKLCEIMSESTDGEGNTIYTVRERTVDAAGTSADEIQEVYPVGGNSYSAGDVGVITGDKEGKRFILSGKSDIITAEIRGHNGIAEELIYAPALGFYKNGESATALWVNNSDFGPSPAGTQQGYPLLKKETEYYTCFGLGAGPEVQVFEEVVTIFNSSLVEFFFDKDAEDNLLGFRIVVT